jgi:hypothetical protein
VYQAPGRENTETADRSGQQPPPEAQEALTILDIGDPNGNAQQRKIFALDVVTVTLAAGSTGRLQSRSSSPTSAFDSCRLYYATSRAVHAEGSVIGWRRMSDMDQNPNW